MARRRSILVLAAVGAAALGAAPGAPARPAGPRLLAVDYGSHRVPGSPGRARVLHLRVLDPHGQVVGVQAGPPPTLADGACGLGGRRNGRPADYYLPMRLSPGRHRLSIRLVSSPCDGRRVTRTVRLRRTVVVRRAG